MDNKELWKNILLRLEPSIKKAHFITWFQNTAITENTSQTIIVGVPTIFAKDWIEAKYHIKIFQAAQEQLPEITEVKYEVCNSLNDPADTRRIDLRKLLQNNIKQTRKLPNKAEIKIFPGVNSKILSPKYTLENFICGKENKLAHAVCQAVAHNPGSLYNPLFIYGGVGLGKTHLLQATGNQIIQDDPSKVVVYMTSEKFMNEIIIAIGNKKTKSFKDRYRNVDCFIIDDIQFLEDKVSTQAEFFHTFNELYDNNKQIIISSDKPPKELKGIQERLLSRFQMGMVVDVVMPTIETKVSILEKKCLEHQFLLPHDLIEFIASNMQGSIREIEGVLLQTIAQAKIENSTPTIRSVTELLSKLNIITNPKDSGNNQENISINNISDVIAIVADHFHLTEEDLVSNQRRKEITIARQICMYLIRNELDKPFESIGEQFGGRSHTTVMHACSKIDSNIKKDQRLLSDIHSIKQAMGL